MLQNDVEIRAPNHGLPATGVPKSIYFYIMDQTGTTFEPKLGSKNCQLWFKKSATLRKKITNFEQKKSLPFLRWLRLSSKSQKVSRTINISPGKRDFFDDVEINGFLIEGDHFLASNFWAKWRQLLTKSDTNFGQKWLQLLFKSVPNFWSKSDPNIWSKVGAPNRSSLSWAPVFLHHLGAFQGRG